MLFPWLCPSKIIWIKMLPKPKDGRLVLILVKLISSQLQHVYIYQYCMEGYLLQTYNPLWVLWHQPVIPGVWTLPTAISSPRLCSSFTIGDSCCMLSSEVCNESHFFSWGKHSGLTPWRIYCNSVRACQISTPSIEIICTPDCAIGIHVSINESNKLVYTQLWSCRVYRKLMVNTTQWMV